MNEFNDHKIFWDEKYEVVRLVIEGDVDEKIAEWLLTETDKIATQYGNNLEWLLELRKVKSSSSRGRKVISEAVGHTSIRKYAMVGAPTFIKTVSNFIISASGKKNAKHFSTEEEALKWLNE